MSDRQHNEREDRAARGGSARYGRGGPSTGSNEPRRGERKERREDWVRRQGGDQTRDGDGDSQGVRPGDVSEASVDRPGEEPAPGH